MCAPAHSFAWVPRQLSAALSVVAPSLRLDRSAPAHAACSADCPTYDHVVQLFVCCGTADGMLPPCDPCQPTVWADTSSGSGITSSHGSSSSGHSNSGVGDSNDMALPLLPSEASRHNGSARALAAAQQEQAALLAQQQPNGKQCGRELGRWVTPFRCDCGFIVGRQLLSPMSGRAGSATLCPACLPA